MKTPAALLPDLPVLTARLTTALNSSGWSNGPLQVLDRKLPQMMSTFPNETVVCRLSNGRKHRIFVKYEAGKSHDCYGHRGGVRYEAQVYQAILQNYPGFRPRLLGAHTDPQTGETWLILEFLDRCVRVSDISVRQATRQPAAMMQAASWIGRFHAAQENPSANNGLAFLKQYDREYYSGWCRRTAELTRPLHQRFPWLPQLCELEEEWLKILLAAPWTIIHGEFYAKTVMFRDQTIYILDWESTAIAAGEIDLAAMTEGIYWPETMVRDCERHYQRARWPEGPPANFKRTLDASRIYLHFRWLGERPDWATREKTMWRYDQLYAAAKRLGMI